MKTMDLWEQRMLDIGQQNTELSERQPEAKDLPAKQAAELSPLLDQRHCYRSSSHAP